MPYNGVPASQTAAMEQCVQKVMAQGHDKSSAIAICHDAMVSKDTQTASPNATYATGPGGLFNTPGLGGGKRKKRKVVNAMPGMKESTAPIATFLTALKELLTRKATWTTGDINNFPDSNFLYVEGGGKKDSDGKTVPRSLRHFPYKDSSGAVDLPHLRNALARIPQSNIPADKKASLTKRAQDILQHANESKETKEIGESTFTVIKQKDGSYRWFATSSNAYKDHDQEIVSTQALAADCDRLDASKDYGPLRWWHMGDLNSGVDIGTCDFNAMNGRMLIESGTFKDAIVAEAVRAKAADIGVSVGFTHPQSEPAGGVYYHIKRFERSVLPRPQAANPYTSFDVNKELDSMATMQEKWKEFVSLFNGDEGQARKYVSANLDTQKELDMAGVKHKEQEQAALPPVATPSLEQVAQAAQDALAAPLAAAVAADAAVAEKDTNPRGAMFAQMKKAGTYDEAKARPQSGAAPSGTPVASVSPVAPDAAAQSGDMWAGDTGAPDASQVAPEEPLPDISGMTVAELHQAIAAGLAELIMASKELREVIVSEVSAQLTLTEVARTKEVELTAKKLGDLHKRVKSLEGDADVPTGFRASREGPAVTDANRLKEQQPQIDPLVAQALAGLFGPQAQ